MLFISIKIYNVCYIIQNDIYLHEILNIKIMLLPKIEEVLVNLGENIKLARLRRNYSSILVAERAGISRNTLVSIEKGKAGVSIGNYIQVLFVLGLEKDLEKVALDDKLGRKLQDAKIQTRKRAPKKK